ncbi:MAG: cyclic nucleotide-binding domain-containing protein [Actinobacteria bacterium]|nr:cyclic nucleotide-binding domain-containing protein [Actinomycetota bacterium]
MASADPDILKKVTVFSSVPAEGRSKLLAAAEETAHAEGDELTQEGVIGHRFHLILDGGGIVLRGGAPIAEVHTGDFVGEIALLGGGRYTATVRCTQPTTCLTIDREPFWSLLEDEPTIALRILEVVCRRTEQLMGATPTANFIGHWVHADD